VETQRSPEEVVRKFFDCYSQGRPEDFDEVVAPDYLDFGHDPAGRGPQGARDDYEQAVKYAGAVIPYTIDGLIVDGDMVAADWTGTLPSGDQVRGMGLYRCSGGLLRSTRHVVYASASSSKGTAPATRSPASM
jgi:SnoaL-like domain